MPCVCVPRYYAVSLQLVDCRETISNYEFESIIFFVLFLGFVHLMEFGTLVWFFGGFLPFPNQQDAILDGDPSAPWGSDSMRFDSDFECSRKLSKSRVGGLETSPL